MSSCRQYSQLQVLQNRPRNFFLHPLTHFSYLAGINPSLLVSNTQLASISPGIIHAGKSVAFFAFINMSSGEIEDLGEFISFVLSPATYDGGGFGWKLIAIREEADWSDEFREFRWLKIRKRGWRTFIPDLLSLTIAISFKKSSCWNRLWTKTCTLEYSEYSYWWFLWLEILEIHFLFLLISIFAVCGPWWLEIEKPWFPDPQSSELQLLLCFHRTLELMKNYCHQRFLTCSAAKMDICGSSYRDEKWQKSFFSIVNSSVSGDHVFWRISLCIFLGFVGIIFFL